MRQLAVTSLGSRREAGSLAGGNRQDAGSNAHGPKLMADKPFGRYGPMQPQAVRQPEVIENETLEQLRKAWKDYPYSVYIPIMGRYKAAMDTIKNIYYSARDVENFSIVLSEFEHEKYFSFKAGLFLTALINDSQERDFVIHTAHLSQEPSWLCLKNKKNVTVNGAVGTNFGASATGGVMIVDGNTGGLVGQEMNDGIIVVKGNGSRSLGNRLTGGVIIIKGDAEHSAGYGMVGGLIIIEGNAGFELGSRMCGGEIHLEGRYKSLGEYFFGGRIYQRDNLIAGKSV